jgi:hypothetical protein
MEFFQRKVKKFYFLKKNNFIFVQNFRMAEEISSIVGHDKEDAIELLENSKNKFDPKDEGKAKFINFKNIFLEKKAFNKEEWNHLLELKFN